MAVNEQKLLAAIDAKLSSAYGGDTSSQLSETRAKMIEAYLGLNTNPAPEGRSQVRDRSVYETIHTMLPSLVRIFAGSSDEVCKYMPVGPEDEPAAELTTAYMNHLITQKNQWEQICADWIFDALLFPNSYAMAYWDDEETVERETYEGQSDEQVALLMQDDDLTILEHSSYPDEDAQPQIDPMTMAPMQAAAMLHDIVAERTNRGGKLKLCVLPAEHCIVDGDTPNWMMDGADFFEYREKKTIASLRAMGLKVDEDIGDSINLDDTEEDRARDRHGENTRDARENGEGVMRKVTTRMVWIRCDCGGDEPRMYYCILVGRNVLYCEPCGRIPVASMVAQPMPHRHPGMSVAETVLDLQEIGTAITRGGLDNLMLANNGRHVISDQVNLDDFLDSRPGSLVRMKGGALPGQGHVLPLTHPFAFDQIIGSLEYFDQKRQNRVGTSRYFSGTDAGAINKTASGIAQLTNASAQRVEHVARMMAPAVEYLFSVCHELVLKHNNKREMIKLKGQWVPIDPTNWQTKRDVRISVGVGAGNKDSLLANLNMVLQEQIMLAQSPYGVVDGQNIYATVIEQMKLQGFANPEKFWTNPAEKPPQPQGPPPQVMVEQMKLQHDGQKTQFQAQAEMQKAQMDNQVKLQIAQMQEQTKVLLGEMKAAMEAQQQRFDAQVQQITAQQNEMKLGMEGFKAVQSVQKDAADMRMKHDDMRMKHEQATTEQKSSGEAMQKMMQDLVARIEGSRVAGVQRITDPKGNRAGYRVQHADGTTRDVPIQ